MGDLYGILGLPRNASEEEIKAAYRALARQLHPDVNAGGEAAAQRLQEINRAYETLGNAEARAAYDCDLVRRSGEARRRFAVFGGITAATFALTMAVVSFAVRWHLEAAPRTAMPHAPQKVMALQPRQDDAEAEAPRKPAANWTTYHYPGFGFALRYPAGIFVLDSRQSTADVRTFVSRDGRALLRMVAMRNTTRTTPARFRRALMKKRYAGASFEPTPRRRYWFALSGTRGDDVFFERVTFSCDSKSMHGWQMVYPASARATYDKIAKLVLRNYPHGNGPGAGCADARKRPRRARR